MNRTPLFSLLGTVSGTLIWYAVFGKVAIVGGLLASAFMLTVGNRLVVWLSRDHFKNEAVVENLEPEPPSQCPDCGCSMYLADRDDDGVCDECWCYGVAVGRSYNCLNNF